MTSSPPLSDDSCTDPPRRHARRGLGPAWLLLPILSVLALALGRRAGLGGGDAGVHEAAPPPIESGRTSVEGWSASLPLKDGAVLTARLVPLHVDASRQAFEAEALRSRFALAPGAPWRLTLRLAAAGGAANPSSPNVTDLPLAGLDVEGFSPIVSAAAPRDPVAALFAAPAGSLAPGQEVDLFLWRTGADGGAPTARALARVDGETLGVLLPTRLDAPRTSESLARMDPRDAASSERAPRASGGKEPR